VWGKKQAFFLFTCGERNKKRKERKGEKLFKKTLQNTQNKKSARIYITRNDKHPYKPRARATKEKERTMRPIVDKRVDDSPSYNVARDRFVGTTFTGETTTTTTNKKPFGVLHYRAGNEKEMVFTPNSPNKSRLSTHSKNQYGNHYPLKCLDANAILMASPSLNDNTKNTKNSLKRSSILLMQQQQQKRDGVRKSATTTRDGENINTFTPEISASSSSSVNATTIPTSPVLSLLRTMFSSWNYPNNGTTVIAAEDILSPAADVAKFECGRTPKSSPVDFSTAQEHHDTALANALFISEASKRLQKICNEQRTRALLDASANGISPGSSRILIDSVDGGCMSSSSDEDEDEEEIESASMPSSPRSEKEEVMTIADEKEVEEQTTPMSSMAMPTRALFSSPGKASLTDDDVETEEKLEMTIDDDDDDEEYEMDGKYALLYAKMKTAVQVNAERYIRAAKRCSGDKVARENFCYKLWHHEAFSELFLSATFTALCELSLRLKSAFVWNDSNANAGANIVAVGIESAYFVNYFVDQIGKCLGAAMSSSAMTIPSSSPLHFTTPTTLAERRNYDDKFIYSCIAYAFAYVFVRAVFFVFDKSKDVSYWEKKFLSFHHKVVQNFTPVKRFVEKKRARWDLVCNRLSDDDDNAEAALMMKTP